MDTDDQFTRSDWGVGILTTIAYMYMDGYRVRELMNAMMNIYMLAGTVSKQRESVSIYTWMSVKPGEAWDVKEQRCAASILGQKGTTYFRIFYILLYQPTGILGFFGVFFSFM